MKTKHPIIIGFSGRKRSGKDTVCCIIETQLSPYGNTVILSIASYLKQLCADLIGTDVQSLNTMKNDNVQFADMTWYKQNNEQWAKLIHDKTNIPVDDILPLLKNVTIHDARELLQFIGTDIIRRFYPDWHIDELCKEIDTYGTNDIILVSDVRFPNELKKLNEYNADIYYIMRPRYWDISNHASETALSWHDFPLDHVLVNDGSVHDLALNVTKSLYNQNFGDSFIDWHYPTLEGCRSLLPQHISQYRGYIHFLLLDNNKIDGLPQMLIDQNPLDRVKSNNGVLHIKADTQEQYKALYIYLLLDEPFPWGQDIKEIEFYNPCILEDLKRYFNET